ncbi:hypothetical protein JHD50_05620 [Sulfurimonas sp. MAG313]|nr:hypothetical protein [Sulfurimonas sp. MAG313]MDF1880787.1 hypothetical protein [Sulfurimonas sp. MAG313]
MIRPLISLFFLFIISAQAYELSLTGILHSEYEQTYAKDNNTSLGDDSNSFSTSYIESLYVYDFTDDIFVSLGAKANYVVGNSTYTTPEYLRTKLSSDDINQMMISEASLNYSDDLVSFSVGRHYVDFDWIQGSIDGVIASIGNDEEHSLRMFWFNEFEELTYNYYVNITNINENLGMYGMIFKTHFTDDFELSIYNYYMQDLRNLAGAEIKYMHEAFALNLAYTRSDALSLALYVYDEEFWNASMEYLFNQKNYIEVGLSKTGKNGLFATGQLGSFMFGQFYLSNQVDRENALNGFAHYLYVSSSWRFDLIAGATQYDNSYIRIEDALFAAEIDTYLRYQYNSNVAFELGAMAMRVDERDPLQSNQSLVIFNLVLSYDVI